MDKSLDAEPQDQEQESQDRARRHGQLLRREIDRGKLTRKQALDMFQATPRLHAHQQQFMAGLNDAPPVEVAS